MLVWLLDNNYREPNDRQARLNTEKPNLAKVPWGKHGKTRSCPWVLVTARPLDSKTEARKPSRASSQRRPLLGYFGCLFFSDICFGAGFKGRKRRDPGTGDPLNYGTHTHRTNGTTPRFRALFFCAFQGSPWAKTPPGSVRPQQPGGKTIGEGLVWDEAGWAGVVSKGALGFVVLKGSQQQTTIFVP